MLIVLICPHDGGHLKVKGRISSDSLVQHGSIPFWGEKEAGK